MKVWSMRLLPAVALIWIAGCSPQTPDGFDQPGPPLTVNNQPADDPGANPAGTEPEATEGLVADVEQAERQTVPVTIRDEAERSTVASGGTAVPAGEAATAETSRSAQPGMAASAPAEEQAGGPVTTYSGVYTAAQAERGNQIQQRECALCHTPAEWAQGRVLIGHADRPLFELVDQIRAMMPMDAPGRLSLQEYTDIVAYMLQLGSYPTGGRELPANEAALRGIQIEYRR